MTINIDNIKYFLSNLIGNLIKKNSSNTYKFILIYVMNRNYMNLVELNYYVSKFN